MDGNQSAFDDIVRLAEVSGMFVDDRDNDALIRALLANKEQVERDNQRTSCFLTSNREEHGKKVEKAQGVEKQITTLEREQAASNEAFETKLREFNRLLRGLREEAESYHQLYVVSWERTAANDVGNIEKLEDDVSMVRRLAASKPLARGGTLLQARVIFEVSKRSDVYRLIREKGKNKISYARALIRFMWRIGLAECPEWLGFREHPPNGYTPEVFQARWPFLHIPAINHRWDQDECAERFSDMLALPLGLTSEFTGRRCPVRCANSPWP